MTKANEEAIRYRQALYARTPFPAKAMNRLWNSTVGVVGLGSGGGGVALDLVRAGVGHLRLCDCSTLTPANVSRHELGRRHVGISKARGIADHIREINPYTQVEIFERDLFGEDTDEERERFFDGLDLVDGATDSTFAQLSINQEAVKRGIPAEYAGCYESALGGEILIWIPGWKVPCLECLRGGLNQPEQKGEIDYSNAHGPEDYEGEPGLYSAIKLVASIESEIALAILLRDEPASELGKIINPPKTFLLIGGSRAEGFYRFRKEFDIYWQPLSGPRSDCGVCQPRSLGTRGDDSMENMEKTYERILDEISQEPEGEIL